ncbi:hypothetical protein JFN94_25905 [Burkholderia anthina]|uniref:Uncharacterized protein n=1 Tax=Burkholderia anthina TaxID=179879 RepID=A0A7T6VJ97_9BURK|nr:hypothetical protein [Burkholderia anthina]QQK04766.1 hypothetical protein JFN94_25905 [Burkholderia anthina]
MGALLQQSTPASAGVFVSGGDVFQEFPMWVNGPNGAQQIVESQEAFDALGEGWKKPVRVELVPREQAPDFIEYPKWVGRVLVHSAEEEAALAQAAAVDADEQVDDERTALIQIAEEKGIKIDRRWSNDKIRAALEAV